MAMDTMPPSSEVVPAAGRVLAMMVSLLSTSVLTLFLMVFAIYTDSYVFVFASAMLQHSIGVNSSLRTCDSAILICLVCYVTTKFIYLFLVEKAHIIRCTPKKRVSSRLYMFNSVGMLGVYLVVVILNFVFRIARLQDGECIIGMKSFAMIPLISFDTVVNVYLTIIFLIPLRKLYSYKNMPRTHANMRLRTIAFRTFCGAVCTLLSSMINLSVLMSLDGEPGWVCLMSCNCDILFSAAVIQWVTSKDNAGTSSASSTSGGANAREANGHGTGTGNGHDSTRALTPGAAQSSTSTPLDISLVPTARSSTQSEIDRYADRTPSGGVIITTTIERETKRGGVAEFQGRAIGIPKGREYHAAEEGCADFDDDRQEAYGSRVSITAGQLRPISSQVMGGRVGLE
ncbi:hypothetical protein VFPPC_12906 [Pochonia chlamydosporia 170]|uniref:Uncharacterized protein n=1 Tax=Pochonia chlamydosporia 170 TaxID=1380566 RepID=A0A179G557_METCM|nr:hypothetical protein VFPPC_12906 [Pochonia chlamydosporia 170]OAQ72995.2 hypothetical protein VFPPC_12906 [Pochonia chlamydosporia 170]